MKLTDFCTASDSEYLWLQNKIDSLPVRKPFVFTNCELPNGCTPNATTVGIIRTSPGYILYTDPIFNYFGDNLTLKRFSLRGQITCAEWQELRTICRSFANGSSDRISASTPAYDIDEVTDWKSVLPPAKSETTLSYETILSDLKKSVIGQDSAVETVAYQTSIFLKKENPKRPMSILAYGPPGTGKSETAKALSNVLAQLPDHPYATVWTDLNTFTEAHTVYRLIGAPPGYVGYDEEPTFEAVTHNPYTIFIFDELDKAHPEVIKTFMAILDEGRCASRNELSDHSREYNFKHCIFFFTSNYDLNAKPTMRKQPIGFSFANDVDEISYEGDHVDVQYKDMKQEVVESLQMRIYHATEKARKAFVELGVLREIASRFQNFVEFSELTDEAKTRILAKQIIETGFEYGVRIIYISPSIMQGLIEVATSENSLTVRSFKAVIEGYLANFFSKVKAVDAIQNYRLEGIISNPILNPA